MGDRRTLSAEELAQLTPEARAEVVRQGFETDLSKVSPALLERARRRVEAHTAADEGPTPADR